MRCTQLITVITVQYTTLFLCGLCIFFGFWLGTSTRLHSNAVKEATQESQVIRNGNDVVDPSRSVVAITPASASSNDLLLLRERRYRNYALGSSAHDLLAREQMQSDKIKRDALEFRAVRLVRQVKERDLQPGGRDILEAYTSRGFIYNPDTSLFTRGPRLRALDPRPQTPFFVNGVSRHKRPQLDPPPPASPTPAERARGKSARILAFVLTFPDRHATQAINVNNTWGRHVDDLLFMSTESYPGLNIHILSLDGKSESRSLLWRKVQLSWRAVYEKYIEKASSYGIDLDSSSPDWFIKADDDSFFLIDNLRALLGRYDPDTPYFLGRRFGLRPRRKMQQSRLRQRPPHNNQGHQEGKGEVVDDNIPFSYNSGGAGYVLSRGALRLLGTTWERAFNSGSGIESSIVSVANGSSLGTDFAEDVEMGKVMRRLGVGCVDTRDAFGRETFIPLNIFHLRERYTRLTHPKLWLWRYSYYPTGEGFECCSRYWISTHYIRGHNFQRLADAYNDGSEGKGLEPIRRDPTPYVSTVRVQST